MHYGKSQCYFRKKTYTFLFLAKQYPIKWHPLQFFNWWTFFCFWVFLHLGFGKFVISLNPECVLPVLVPLLAFFAKNIAAAIPHKIWKVLSRQRVPPMFWNTLQNFIEYSRKNLGGKVCTDLVIFLDIFPNDCICKECIKQDLNIDLAFCSVHPLF